MDEAVIDALILAGALLSGPGTAGTATQAIVHTAATLPKAWRPFADCVAQRESHANPRSLNRSSGAAGKWQFLPSWQHGLPFMVRDRLIATGMSRKEANRVRRVLAAAPINRWREHYQDIGFAAALLAPNGQGWRHWSLPGHPCQGLVPGFAR